MATKDNDTRYICHACIGDEYLSNEVETQGVSNQCGYCDETGNSLTLGLLADRIHNALQEHYELTPNGPVDWYEHYKASEGEWERRGDPAEWVIAEAAGLDEKPAKDVIGLLSDQHGYWAIREEGREDPYGYDAMYERREPNDRSSSTLGRNSVAKYGLVPGSLAQNQKGCWTLFWRPICSCVYWR